MVERFILQHHGVYTKSALLTTLKKTIEVLEETNCKEFGLSLVVTEV